MQDEYSALLELVKNECEEQLKQSGLPDGVVEALHERGRLFGEHPEMLAVLPFLTYRAVGGKNVTEIAPAAAAVEFLLAAADVLDDVQDRYVPESVDMPDRLQNYYISETEILTSLVLLGDQSIISLVRKDIDQRRASRAISTFKTFEIKAFSGQYDDVHAKLGFDTNLEKSLEITRQKAGNVARCAAQLGAVLGTDDESMIELTGEYAEHFVLARQLHDDVSNLWPNTGRGEDLEQLKPTMPLTYTVMQSKNGTGDRVPGLRNLVNLDRIAGPQVQQSPVGGDIAKARNEIFTSGAIHFTLLQALINLVKAQSMGRRIDKKPAGEGLLERIASS